MVEDDLVEGYALDYSVEEEEGTFPDGLGEVALDVGRAYVEVQVALVVHWHSWIVGEHSHYRTCP
jgi:hypothetical protein